MDPVLSISRRILNLSGWTFSNCTRSSTPPASADVGLRIGCTVPDPVVIRALTSMLTAYGTRSAGFVYPSAEILEQNAEVGGARGRRERRTRIAHLAFRRCPRF